jgi:hypothetical protein
MTPYTLSQRCRQKIYQWYAEQRHNPVGPVDHGLYTRIVEVLKQEPAESVPESIYIALAAEVDRDSGSVVDDSEWPRQATVAKGLGRDKVAIGRLIKKGELKTNGKEGNDCRVNPASVLAYCEREGVAYNDDDDDS